MYKKPVIIFEGIEGSGKTYHSNNLAKYLKKKKIDYLKLREPGGCLNSEKIRKLILNKNSNFDKNTDAYDIIIEISHNTKPTIKNKGSAIFIHCSFFDNKSTAGCIALNKKDILKRLGKND